MARTHKAAAAPRNPTRGETILQEFANVDSSLEQLRQRAALLLNNKELLRDVQGLTPEDQTIFVDKIDQVCRAGSSFSLGIFPPLFLPRHIRLPTRKM
jgi:hypothetical protein